MTFINERRRKKKKERGHSILGKHLSFILQLLVNALGSQIPRVYRECELISVVFSICAALHGHEAVIDSLVASDASLLNARDCSGSTPLHETMKGGHLTSAVKIMRLGADVSLVDDIGQTVLHVAALSGNAEAVEYILERGLIDVNREASFGITPLMAAQRGQRAHVVDILIKKGATR